MTRKYALFGSGNTGSKIPEMLQQDETYQFFNSKNPPTVESLQGFDAIICFVPGPTLLEYIELLAETNIPVISGATAMVWPEQWHERLVAKGVTWLWADNFALGMNIVKTLINQLAQQSSLYQDPSFHIHESHHVNKLDAPSGTAIRWRGWLGKEAEMSYERLGDIVGTHELTMKTEFETIKITHEAQDRRIFAHGALWACRALLNEEQPKGLISLDYLTAKYKQGEYNVNNQSV